MRQFRITYDGGEHEKILAKDIFQAAKIAKAAAGVKGKSPIRIEGELERAPDAEETERRQL